jgi:hypothetical protein
MPARTTDRLLLLLAFLLPAGLPAAEGPSWREPVEIATGPGVKGPWQQNDSRYEYVDDGTAAFGPRGELALAWVNQARKDVFLRSPGRR